MRNLLSVLMLATCACTMTTGPRTPPYIATIAPDSVYPGSTNSSVVVHGNGFLNSNTVIVGPDTLKGVYGNVDGTILVFVVPLEIRGKHGTQMPWPTGIYPVTITNANGMSNTVTIKIINAIGVDPDPQ